MNQASSSAVVARIVKRIETQGYLPDSPGVRLGGGAVHLCAGACVVSETLRERDGDAAAAHFDERVTRTGGKLLLVSEAARLGIVGPVKGLVTENDNTDRQLRTGRLIERIATAFKS